LANLLNWLREAEPDIVCLQELKAADTEFPAEAIRQAGYRAVCRGERRWNGVAILARWTPVVTRMDLPGDTADGQCRYLEAAVNGVLVASIHAPNGNPQPGPKFHYEPAWLKRLNDHAAELYAAGAPVVLAGDYNVVPTDLDSYSTKSWDRNTLLHPESRAAYQRLLAQGWTDAIRALHPKEPMYTFWDYMRKRWERDGGLRYISSAEATCQMALSYPSTSINVWNRISVIDSNIALDAGQSRAEDSTWRMSPKATLPRYILFSNASTLPGTSRVITFFRSNRRCLGSIR
jgi:exodeoxyribonuclease III